MDAQPRNGADPIARLVQVLGKLPGIGEKTATRLAFFVIKQSESYARELADALVDATTKIRFCARCQNFTQTEVCALCSDMRRDDGILCVVENVSDLYAIERSNEFRGRYHVLHGAIAPLDGIGPEQIKLKELLQRLATAEAAEVREVIVATNPSVDGEATALYLLRVLGPLGIKVSRIASGMPIGGDFEYADPATISRALSGRTTMG